MIIKRKQKSYSDGIEVIRGKKWKFVIPKHDIIDAKAAMERHIIRGGEEEGERFLALYRKLAGKKPHKFFQKVVKK